MKIREIIETQNFINRIKLNKFDKDIRLALVKNYPILDKAIKEYNEYRESLQKKIFEGKDEDITKVQEIRSRLNQKSTFEEIRQAESDLQPYKEFLELEMEFATLITQKLEEDLDLSLSYINKDEFIENLVKADIDFTFVDLLKINILFE